VLGFKLEETCWSVGPINQNIYFIFYIISSPPTYKYMGNSEKGLHLTTRPPIGSIPRCKCQDQRSTSITLARACSPTSSHRLTLRLPSSCWLALRPEVSTEEVIGGKGSHNKEGKYVLKKVMVIFWLHNMR
jgi:hypothetical protein